MTKERIYFDIKKDFILYLLTIQKKYVLLPKSKI
jgi:hypothetical protein